MTGCRFGGLMWRRTLVASLPRSHATHILHISQRMAWWRPVAAAHCRQRAAVRGRNVETVGRARRRSPLASDTQLCVRCVAADRVLDALRRRPPGVHRGNVCCCWAVIRVAASYSRADRLEPGDAWPRILVDRRAPLRPQT